MPGAGPRSSGVVSLLFTDVVGSTELLDRLGDDGAEELRCRHFDILRRAVADAGGEEVKNLGDGLMASFTSPLDALRCAVDMQRAVAENNGREPDSAVQMRIGIHAGEAIADGGDYFGTAVVVAKRLCDRAAPGQILVGDLLRVLVGSRGGFRFSPAGRLTLKGLAEPLAAATVEWDHAAGRSAPAPAGPLRLVRRRRPIRGGTTIVGRDHEFARLDAEFSRARTGELRCVLVTSEPGLGKTRLADEFTERHAAAAHVLSARAYPLGGTVPFSLFIDALEAALEALPPEDVSRLCSGFVDDLAGLLHGVAAVAGRGSGGEVPRLRLIEGMAHIFDGLGRDRPVITVLDDVHLADPSSWEVLRHLIRRLPDLPLLVIATARPSELAAGDLAAQVLLEAEQDGVLTRLELGPLSRSDLAALAEVLTERPAPPALVDWVEERTRGNPLFANGLIRALIEEGGDLAAPKLERLPESLTERIVSRMNAYGEAERRTTELIAVLGRPVTLGELVRIADRPLEDVARVLGVLLAARAITEEERGRDLIYEIHHPLVRDVIYRAIGGARRRLMHRELAGVLRRDGRIGEAARHFARSADVGDPEAIDALREAVRQTEAQEAYREALELLGELGELLPTGDRRWLEVSEAMSWRAEWVVDHRADAHALQGIRALRELDGLLAMAPDPARRAAVKFRLANFLAWGTGELEEARSALIQAAALFGEAGERREALLAERELAWVEGLQGHFAVMEDEAIRLVKAAENLGDRFVEMQALTAVAYADAFLARFTAAEERLDRAFTIATEDLKAYRATALAALRGATLGLAGRVDEAMAVMRQAKAADPEYRDSVLLELETEVLRLAGDHRGALASAREAVAWNPGLCRRRAMGAAFAVIPALELGAVAEAEQFLRRSQQALGGRDFSTYRQFCDHAEGLLAWEHGRPHEALAAMRRASSAMLDKGAWGFAVFRLIDLAEVENAAGDHAAGRITAGHLRRIADATGHDGHRGLAALAAAWAEGGSGNATAAAAQARTAVDALSSTGWAALTARAHDALGRATATSDRPAALAAFREAIDRFDAFGAIARRDRSLEALRALGSPGRRAAAAAGGPDTLTAREREVARLAASGLSAKEIADELFVSERTVETHLTRVYAKLGVTGKVDLVRRAAELPI